MKLYVFAFFLVYIWSFIFIRFYIINFFFITTLKKIPPAANKFEQPYVLVYTENAAPLFGQYIPTAPTQAYACERNTLMNLRNFEPNEGAF